MGCELKGVRPSILEDMRQVEQVGRRRFGKILGLSGLATAVGGVAAPAAERAMGLELPTDNAALFKGGGSGFYMYTDRSFEGVRSKPWQGGTYGYSRNPKRVGGGLVYTKFHEGVDIKPARRNSAGEPLDDVRAIGAGRVVYANTVSSRSSYGNYVVVEHDWGSGPFYSLSAHLMSVAVKPGQRVKAGSTLGRLGYTGVGINRTRAHLHLELKLLLNAKFQSWHSRHYTSPNHHSVYNGLNMAGVDIAGLLVAERANPGLRITEFIGRMQPYFKVVVPKASGFDLVKRYPWLLKRSARGKSWEITFSRSGVPLAVVGSGTAVKFAAVTWVKSSPYAHAWNTRSRLTGSGSKAGLSSGGGRYVQLVAGTF